MREEMSERRNREVVDDNKKALSDIYPVSGGEKTRRNK
jgi:hypothetical protein